MLSFSFMLCSSEYIFFLRGGSWIFEWGPIVQEWDGMGPEVGSFSIVTAGTMKLRVSSLPWTFFLDCGWDWSSYICKLSSCLTLERLPSSWTGSAEIPTQDFCCPFQCLSWREREGGLSSLTENSPLHEGFWRTEHIMDTLCLQKLVGRVIFPLVISTTPNMAARYKFPHWAHSRWFCWPPWDGSLHWACAGCILKSYHLYQLLVKHIYITGALIHQFHIGSAPI